MYGLQKGNDLGGGHSLGWWLDRAALLRHYMIEATAQEVGAVLGPPLGNVAAWSVRNSLRYVAPALLPFRQPESQQLAHVSALMSEHWAAQYARALGAGLGDKSADGMLISLQMLHRENVADDIAWRIISNVAGLPQGQALSVTQIALARLKANVKARRMISATDVGRDLAKVAVANRARHILETENEVAANFGTQLLLMHAVQKGYLPADTKKVWVTAVDERVCPVCAPMDSVAVDLDAPFELHPYTGILNHGVRIWVPPAHPNCRCRIVTDKTIEHGIITRTARFSADENRRARLRSRLADLMTDAGPSWSEADRQ